MPGFNTLPAVGGGGGQANMTYVASIHMNTYNRRWAQGGTPGYYAIYSTNQENGYAYFVGATTTGVSLNRLVNISHSFTRIDVIAPQNDMLSLYKAKVKSTTEFPDAFAAFSSFPALITSSGNFVLPNNALPLVNVLINGGGGGSGNSSHTSHGGSGGGGGGGVVKLTAYQAVGTTGVTVGGGGSPGNFGGRTYFGNVYALGGGWGNGHNQSSQPAGGAPTGANGGGGGGYYGQSHAAAVGAVQTASTGLGNSGSPVYHGGFAGGRNTSNGSNGHNRGGGGAGAGGNGADSGYNEGGNGGPGHVSDIEGSNHTYGPGGRGHGGHGGGGSQGWDVQGLPPRGHGGGADSGGGSGGGTGAVIVRYYIP